MSGLVAFRRNAALVWTPAEGDAIPVHRLQDLEAHLSAWRDYGHAVTIRQQSRNDREVTVTALGRDGWLVAVHDVTMLTSGWHRHKILTRCGIHLECRVVQSRHPPPTATLRSSSRDTPPVRAPQSRDPLAYGESA